jgi:pimeloyl-ACP methyl ester carboxylesterase
LHYLTAGHGPVTVILMRGYAETSRMWRPLMPKLAEKFTVIAPDLPGIGDSSIPTGKIGMISAAESIHALVRSLGVEKARVVGHDIGLMVAYAYATKFPDETEKLALMDAFLPGVSGWEPIYNSPNVWHFRFHGEYPEKLVQGRERTYFEYFWNVFAADKTHSIPEAERKAYTAAYAKPGRTRRVGLLRQLAGAGEGLCAALADEADHAAPLDRRQEFVRQGTGRANQTGGEQSDRDRSA